MEGFYDVMEVGGLLGTPVGTVGGCEREGWVLRRMLIDKGVESGGDRGVER